LITYDGSTIEIDKKQIDRLPEHPMILISNLSLDPTSAKYRPVPLTKMATALSVTFKIDEVTLFSIDDSSDFIKQNFPEQLTISNTDESFVEKHIPETLRDLSTKVRLKTGTNF
jgi:hypothetical protein